MGVGKEASPRVHNKVWQLKYWYFAIYHWMWQTSWFREGFFSFREGLTSCFFKKLNMLEIKIKGYTLGIKLWYSGKVKGKNNLGITVVQGFPQKESFSRVILSFGDLNKEWQSILDFSMEYELRIKDYENLFWEEEVRNKSLTRDESQDHKLICFW